MLNSVANALRVLDYLVETGEAGVSEIGREFDVTVGTAHRLVATLVATGFAEQNPENRKYRPGTKLLVLANKMRARLRIRDIAHAHLEGLMEVTHETVNLGVLQENKVLYVDKVTSDQPFGIEARIGSRLPAYCTALGKAMLAFVDEPARQRYVSELRRMRRTDGSPVPPTADAFRTELARVAKAGYAEDQGEFMPDVFCVAAPVLDSSRRAVAAVSISVPKSRFRQRRPDLVKHVRSVAEELSLVIQEIGLTEIA